MRARITSDVREAADVLKAGGLVAFATETVYGLGANALDARAVAGIFAAKERPFFDPLIVHVADRGQVRDLAADVPAVAGQLMSRFWPGPLTLVLPKRDVVPDLVTAGLDSVGLRLPGHPLARELIAIAGCPVAAPSANLFGHVSPTTAAHVAEQLGDRIDLILDGGPCRVGLESTVVDCTGARPILLRPGGTTQEALEAVIGPIEVRTSSGPGSVAPAPGMLERHYSPRTPIRYADLAQDSFPSGRVGVLSFRGTPVDRLAASAVALSPGGDLAEAASRLFAALRQLDAAQLDLILAEPFPDSGLGRAINDRLRRAAAK